MKVEAQWQLNFCDCMILCLVTLIIGILAYHPYYFGDELQPFVYAHESDATLWSVFYEFNKYKARLLFNGIWALGAFYNLPRYVFMLVTVSAVAVSASIIYCVARVQFEAGRLVAFLAGLVLPTSRFATIVYYDYLSGTIESLGALVFLIAVVIVISPKIFSGLSWGRGYVATLLACMAVVLIHERYIAGVVALGAVVAMRGFGGRGRPFERKYMATGAGLAILPALLFISVTKIFGALPLETGTSGMKVAISFDIFWRFLRYCKNVLFGLNDGYPWLVGSLQYVGEQNIAILTGLAVLFCLSYLCFLTIWRREVEWRKVVEVGLLAVALICVASLPEATRQEGRWMIPVLVLMTLMSLHFGRVRVVYVAILLITNLTYGLTGSYRQIANVVASRTTDAIAAPLNRVAPEGHRGLLMNAPDDGAAWVLSGGSGNPNLGQTFSTLNFGSRIVVDPGYSTKKDYDFGLYFTGVDSQLKPLFSYVGSRYVGYLLNPESIGADAGRMIAGKGALAAWRWNVNMNAVNSSDAMELRPGTVGTWVAPISTLDHKLIVYRARALAADMVPMRIQINWDDGKGKFLGAFIKVVNVGKTTENFVAVVAAPIGAREGTVYANLHDGATGTVELSSIRLIGD